MGRHLTTHEIVSLLGSEPFRIEDTKTNTEKIITANHLIKQLQSLGATDAEVATAVGASRWDEVAGNFDMAESLIKLVMKERGMDEEDVEEKITAEEIKRKILIEKMRLAIQKVVLSALS